MNYLFALLRERRKRGVLRLVLKKLRPMLGHAFGKHETYTPEQVREAMERADLLPRELRCGVCLYSSREDYDVWSAATGQPDYWATRSELARLLFRGNLGFSALDVSMAVAALNVPALDREGEDNLNRTARIQL